MVAAAHNIVNWFESTKFTT